MTREAHLDYMFAYFSEEGRTRLRAGCEKCFNRIHLVRRIKAATKIEQAKRLAASQAFDQGWRWGGGLLCPECSTSIRKHELPSG